MYSRHRSLLSQKVGSSSANRWPREAASIRVRSYFYFDSLVPVRLSPLAHRRSLSLSRSLTYMFAQARLRDCDADCDAACDAAWRCFAISTCTWSWCRSSTRTEASLCIRRRLLSAGRAGRVVGTVEKQLRLIGHLSTARIDERVERRQARGTSLGSVPATVRPLRRKRQRFRPPKMSIRTRPGCRVDRAYRRVAVTLRPEAVRLSGGAGSRSHNRAVRVATAARLPRPVRSLNRASASAPDVAAAAATTGASDRRHWATSRPMPHHRLGAFGELGPGVCAPRRHAVLPNDGMRLHGVECDDGPAPTPVLVSCNAPASASPHARSRRLWSASMAEEARYAFDVSWFDPIASMTRKYQLIHYASDGTIEMVQLRPFATPATRGCPGSVLPTTPPPLASQLRTLALHQRGVHANCPSVTRSTTLQTAAPSSSGATTRR